MKKPELLNTIYYILEDCLLRGTVYNKTKAWMRIIRTFKVMVQP